MDFYLFSVIKNVGILEDFLPFSKKFFGLGPVFHRVWTLCSEVQGTGGGGWGFIPLRPPKCPSLVLWMSKGFEFAV